MARWRPRQLLSEPGGLEQYRILDAAGQALAYRQVLQLWLDDAEFPLYWSEQLAASSLSAYLWETPPVNRDTLGRPFEYTLIDSPLLAQAGPDEQAFAEYFERSGESAVASFDNLGGDARLVAPCPLPSKAVCTHLAGFVRNAPKDVLAALWRTVAQEVRKTVSDRPLWISTCGLGVYWLHIRLDSAPKYYHYAPYRVFDQAE